MAKDFFAVLIRKKEIELTQVERYLSELRSVYNEHMHAAECIEAERCDMEQQLLRIMQSEDIAVDRLHIAQNYYLDIRVRKGEIEMQLNRQRELMAPVERNVLRLNKFCEKLCEIRQARQSARRNEIQRQEWSNLDEWAISRRREFE